MKINFTFAYHAVVAWGCFPLRLLHRCGIE